MRLHQRCSRWYPRRHFTTGCACASRRSCGGKVSAGVHLCVCFRCTMIAAAVRNLRGFGAQRLRFWVLWDGGIYKWGSRPARRGYFAVQLVLRERFMHHSGAKRRRSLWESVGGDQSPGEITSNHSPKSYLSAYASTLCNQLQSDTHYVHFGRR